MLATTRRQFESTSHVAQSLARRRYSDFKIDQRFHALRKPCVEMRVMSTHDTSILAIQRVVARISIAPQFSTFSTSTTPKNDPGRVCSPESDHNSQPVGRTAEAN